MARPTSEVVKDITTYLFFSLALLINTLLIFLILTQSPKKIGTYKYLMIYFSVASLLLSTSEFIQKPYVHSNGSCYIVFVKKLGMLSDNEELALLTFSCGVCGMTMSIFAIHFIFRFCAIERKGKLRMFKGWYIFVWMTIPFIVGLMWSATLYTFLGISNRDRITEYMSSSIFEIYGLKMSEIVFFGALYYPPDPLDPKNGEIISYAGFGGTISLTFIMSASLFVIFFFGAKTFSKIRQLKFQGNSAFTKSLQRQLFNALAIQTILPILFVFTPISLLFYLPMLKIDVQSFSQMSNILITIYPALDPLPTIFFVDNYRNAIKKVCAFFGLAGRFTRNCRCQKQVQPGLGAADGTTIWS